MSARAAVFAMVLVLAGAAAYAQPLVLGPEVALGSHQYGLAQPLLAQAALATDGDEIFAVYTSGVINHLRSVYGVRFDRHGALLTSEPLPLEVRARRLGAEPYLAPRVVWAGGHYLVFFAASDGVVYGLRVTRDGAVVGRAPVVKRPTSAMEQFDVATDGSEVVLVGEWDEITRIRSDLTIAGTVPIERIDRDSMPSRGIAYGGGRFAIVMTDGVQATSRFLVDGVLTPPVRIGPANNHRNGPTRVAWTGSTFVAAWVDSVSNEVYEMGLPVWTPLTEKGEAAGSLHALEYIRDPWNNRGVDRYGITLTPLDGETVFITWEQRWLSAARARKLRLSGAPVGDPVDAGVAPLAGARTGAGRLLLLDGNLRTVAIDAPAVAPLPDPLPFASAVTMLPNEELLDAAVSRSEVGLVRTVYYPHPHSFNSAAISILAHDGSPIREVPIVAGQASIATDGSEFFVLLTDTEDALWLVRVNQPSDRVRLDAGGKATAPRLVWNGSELVAMWRERERLWVARLDRSGHRVADDAIFGTLHPLELAAHGDRLLLAWYGDGRQHVTVLDGHGRPSGGTEDLPFQTSDVAIATDGTRDVFASPDGRRAIALAFRDRGRPFVPGPSTVRRDGEELFAPSLVRVAGGYLLGCNGRGALGGDATRTHIELLDRDGVPLQSATLGGGWWAPPALLRTGPRTVLAIYGRSAYEPPYGGLLRLFARTITVADERRGTFSPSKGEKVP